MHFSVFNFIRTVGIPNVNTSNTHSPVEDKSKIIMSCPVFTL